MAAPFRRADCSRLRAALCSPAPCPLPELADGTLCCVALTNAIVLELLSHAKQLGAPNKRVAELLLSNSCVLTNDLSDTAIVRELSRLEKTYSKQGRRAGYWKPLDEVCAHVLGCLFLVTPYTVVSKQPTLLRLVGRSGKGRMIGRQNMESVYPSVLY
jgi:hypothetical protein